MPTAPLPPVTDQDRSRIVHGLIAYFYSGWAFLIPYLSTYLLYAWLKWPVNSAENGAPCLLDVYRLLHVAHLLLAGFALTAWFRMGEANNDGAKAGLCAKALSAERLWPAIPWLLIALFLWIPGAYLEFPADPWAHLARINEWGYAHKIADHSAWEKSSYFLAYTATGALSKLHLLSSLDIYASSCGLLLLWNYYRLGMQVGLQRPFAFLFAAMQIFLLGNSTFTFLRYYGLSSTLFSQLGSIVILRKAIEMAEILEEKQRPAQLAGFIKNLIEILCLATLVYWNHAQGLAISLVGLAVVAAWAVTRRYPKAKKHLWMTVALAAWGAIAWLPRQPAIQDIYRAGGWLAPWYGFNLLWVSSPAFTRAAQILGFFGGINLVAGAFLIYRNHLIGWLTIGPVLALLHPLAAIPLANYFAGRNLSDIIIFSRLFFAIPPGLALIFLAQKWCSGRKTSTSIANNFAAPIAKIRSAQFGFIAFTGCLVAGLAVPPNDPWYSRLWHAVATTPKDLVQHNFQREAAEVSELKSPPQAVVLGSPGLSFIFATYLLRETLYQPLAAHRLYRFDTPRTPAADLEQMERVRNQLLDPASSTTLLGEPRDLFSPFSLAACLSRHWWPQEVAFATTGHIELAKKLLSPPRRDENAGQVSYPRPSIAEHSNNFVSTLRPVPTESAPTSEAPFAQTLYSSLLPQIPSMNSGMVRIEATRAESKRAWANLLLVSTNNGSRGLYLYLNCETNSFYYQFFGHNAGPFPTNFQSGDASRKIQFSWSKNSQELYVDGSLIGSTSFAVPPLQSAYAIHVGLIGLDDLDFWHGKLHPEIIEFNESARNPSGEK